MVVDPDKDVTSEQDEITVTVSAKSGTKKDLRLKETLGRSGIFTVSVPTSIKMPSNTNAVPEDASIETNYGDEFTFTYNDEVTSYADTPSEISCTGKILPGSDGNVRGYSKRFRDSNQAVLVQFRSAECLFEMAKDFRKLKDSEKSSAAIAEGRAILETALRDYPNTEHAAEGEYLLANLYEQLGEEERQIRQAKEKEGEDVSKLPDKSDPLFREAVARFSAILSAWPEGEYAARSQYHKALCLERLGEYSQACEEYVKMTYLFPDNQLVGDAAVRLASHYFKRENRFDIAGKIYSSFRTRFPAHPQAPNALFMGGQCHIRQGEKMIEKAKQECAEKKKQYVMPASASEAYRDAVTAFVTLVEQYKDTANKDLLAQALYWAGDISFRNKEFANAYIYLKRTTFEYPESKWARYARGMLLQNSQAFDVVNE
jgi:outer membrane protein assembly factor BamD (BamD/ComL family)